VTYLTGLAADQEEQKKLGHEGFSSGWAIGTDAWRRTLAKEHAQRVLTPGLAAAEAGALREERWREVLERQLKAAGRTQAEAWADPKTKPWKLELARAVRAESGASITWLVRELGLGTEGTARSLMSKLKHSKIQQYSA